MSLERKLTLTPVLPVNLTNVANFLTFLKDPDLCRLPILQVRNPVWIFHSIWLATVSLQVRRNV